MQIVLAIFLLFNTVLLAGLTIFLLYLRGLLRQKEVDEEGRRNELLSSVQALKDDLKEIKYEVDQTRESSIQTLRSQLEESHRIVKDSNQFIAELTERLVRLEETNKRIEGLASQIQTLENILKNPIQRGKFGECFLELILRNVFPPSQYEIHHRFADGQVVDAVIFIGEKKIPIDSKFPLENYIRLIKENDPDKRDKLEKRFGQDLRNRIDETAKYIRPAEGTLDFALMFIPAEGVYHDLTSNEIGSGSNIRDLLRYAIWEKKVIIVSPNTFYPFIQTILYGLRVLQVEESAREILKNVEMLRGRLTVIQDCMQKLGNQLNFATDAYNKAFRELSKIDMDTLKISDGVTQ